MTVLSGVRRLLPSGCQRETLVTLCGCSEMLTTHHTQFTGVSELCHLGNEAT